MYKYITILILINCTLIKAMEAPQCPGAPARRLTRSRRAPQPVLTLAEIAQNKVAKLVQDPNPMIKAHNINQAARNLPDEQFMPLVQSYNPTAIPPKTPLATPGKVAKRTALLSNAAQNPRAKRRNIGKEFDEVATSGQKSIYN